MAMPKFETVDDYIASFPKDVQTKLTALRRAIKKAVPKAEERISYGIPYYGFHGRLVYFAAFRDHYSLFAVTTSVRKAFSKELASYADSGKGTIRFPVGEAAPASLVGRIAAFRAEENLALEAKKRPNATQRKPVAARA